MSNFAFLQTEFRATHEAAAQAERLANSDSRAACFYARRALELAVAWAYKHDAALKLPYQDNLSALIHEPSFKQTAGEAVFSKARVIITLGNRAVHSHRAIPVDDALVAVRELFHVAYWLARTYGRTARPAPGLVFDAGALPKSAPVPKQNAEQLQQLESALRDRDEKLSVLLADKSALDAELKRLRAEVAEVKKATAAQPDTHDYSEAETRDYFIDLLLKEAGWPLDQARDREFEVAGMPNKEGKGFVDFVLWGDDGKPLGLVEAKRTRRDPRVGQQQAKLYADCLERQFGQRPVIFYSNGYDHWLWDDASYPPRRVQGFYKKAELELVIQRRSSRKPLAQAEINPQIVERFYQTRGIRRIAEAFERDRDRKALVVMATGAGKTRTVIALCDLLMRCNWAKRVLFLADRVALVNQAVNAFKRHMPDAAPVNLVTEKDAEGRVFVSTYPTMMGLIDETRDGQRRFGVGHFDLVIIDEAHRSVFQKYRAIFDYFDSLLVGLTATPKDEVEQFGLLGLDDLQQVLGGVLVVEAAGEGRIGEHEGVGILVGGVILRQRIAVTNVGVLHTMQQHVHAADTQHGVVEVIAVEHVVVEVLPELRVVQDVRVALAQVLARHDEKASRAAGWVADKVGRLRGCHLHHEPDDVARRAELAILPGGRDLAEHVLIEVALGVAILHRDGIEQVHHLGEQRRRGDGEARVLHVVRVS
jgi:type I restriction enzyme R subunit